MQRRTLLASAAGAVLGSALPSLGAGASSGAGRPSRNVLLLIADDQGLDAGCYGTRVRTPRIDALAAQGTRFTQAFAAVSSCSVQTDDAAESVRTVTVSACTFTVSRPPSPPAEAKVPAMRGAR